MPSNEGSSVTIAQPEDEAQGEDVRSMANVQELTFPHEHLLLPT